MKLLFAAVLFFLVSCAGPGRYETELRIRVLEERVNILDAKVSRADSLERARH